MALARGTSAGNGTDPKVSRNRPYGAALSACQPNETPRQIALRLLGDSIVPGDLIFTHWSAVLLGVAV
jgi:hypothetical protein